MNKNRCIVLCLMAMVFLGAPLFGQTGESPADKVNFELEFNASVLSADSEGVVDSMTDAGFNEDGTKIGLSYEDELWGATASLKFANENLRFFNSEISEMFAGPVLALDELYGWIKPFGPVVKFTGGIFENSDGIAGYTDDIDEYGIGVFSFGGGGEPFSKPDGEFNGPALKNGFLTDLVLGPVTVQFLLAYNFSGESATDLNNGLMYTMYEMFGQGSSFVPFETDERFYRLGGRLIFDTGVGTFAAVFKTMKWAAKAMNASTKMEILLAGGDPAAWPEYAGDKISWNTFGGYFDLTAVENLGLSVGYTGLLPLSDASDVDSVLYNGIDLRAAWTGIEGLSLSTHNNISFAKGSKKDWMRILASDDASFFTLYNAIGATKELTEKFSVNAEISNIFSKTDLDTAGKSEYDSFGVAAKFIAKVTEHAEFNAGLRVDVEKTTVSGSDDETLTTFSIPVGIKVNF